MGSLRTLNANKNRLECFNKGFYLCDERDQKRKGCKAYRLCKRITLQRMKTVLDEAIKKNEEKMKKTRREMKELKKDIEVAKEIIKNGKSPGY